MSSISSIFDTLKTLLTTTFPSHYWLSDPRIIEGNSELDLNQGIGLAAGVGESLQREIDKHVWIRREFQVVITRRHFASELNREGKDTVEKDILEDQKTLIIAFMNDPLETIAKSVSKAIFVGDNGVETVFGDNGNFLKLVTRFQVDYREIIQ